MGDVYEGTLRYRLDRMKAQWGYSNLGGVWILRRQYTIIAIYQVSVECISEDKKQRKLAMKVVRIKDIGKR